MVASISASARSAVISAIRILRVASNATSTARLRTSATAAFATSFAVASLSYGIWQSWWLGSLVLMTVWIAGLAAANGAPQPGSALSRF